VVGRVFEAARRSGLAVATCTAQLVNNECTRL
jgi:hypothetical protein